MKATVQSRESARLKSLEHRCESGSNGEVEISFSFEHYTV